MTSDLAYTVDRLLRDLYGSVPDELSGQLLEMAEDYRRRLADATSVVRFDERSAFLITYADSVRDGDEPPLRALDTLLAEYVGDHLTDVHLLPFFPWTSDDGFGVVDHREVNPAVGSWEDVHALGEHYALAFDFVANHTSASSPWFQGWLAGEDRWRGYYIPEGQQLDTSAVVRPRTTPLFHRYPMPDGGTRSAWTTFGPDQVDVDVRTPAVLVELTDVLLGYLVHGATTVRLDAIGFLVKESGTSCLHHPGTHAVVKLWRALVDHVRPGARLLTETNVPHRDNISYFGDGSDEAHMVYQFALPPLVLHAFVSGDASALTRWASTVGPVSDTATWFNFLGSHDGIGLRPSEGLLTDADRRRLAERVVAHGGRASMAHRPDGSQAVYELNVSYLDALCSPEEVEDDAVFSAKAIAAHSILLSLVGVPAIYIHSLLGSRSDLEGMRSSGIARRINRQALELGALREELAAGGRRALVLRGLEHLLAVRAGCAAFSPWAAQEVLDLDHRVVAVRRGVAEGTRVTTLTNVSAESVRIVWGEATDLLTGRAVAGDVELGAHAVLWLADT